MTNTQAPAASSLRAQAREITTQAPSTQGSTYAQGSALRSGRFYTTAPGTSNRARNAGGHSVR